MLKMFLFSVTWVFLVPSWLAAQAVVLPFDPAHLDRPTVDNSWYSKLSNKVDIPADFLIVPFFEVDTSTGAGETTLFAVRNSSEFLTGISFAYLDVVGDLLRFENSTLNANETRSINMRDLTTGPSPLGDSRGFVVIDVVSPPSLRKGIIPQILLTGDFFQVDVAGAFATGERMLNSTDLCREHETRFLDFGNGTNFRLFINNPQGSNPDTNPPSVTVEVLREDGMTTETLSVFTANNSLELSSEVFTSESFGTMIFDFSNSNGGWVYAEYSADGLFSVGLNSACTAAFGD